MLLNRICFTHYCFLYISSVFTDFCIARLPQVPLLELSIVFVQLCTQLITLKHEQIPFISFIFLPLSPFLYLATIFTAVWRL